MAHTEIISAGTDKWHISFNPACTYGGQRAVEVSVYGDCDTTEHVAAEMTASELLELSVNLSLAAEALNRANSA